MVSYYNTLSYPQKHSAANLAYPSSQPWQWSANYHTPPNQFLSDMDSPHAAHHQMYYNPHMFHPAAGPATEWHSPPTTANNFTTQNTISTSSASASAHQMLHHHHHHAHLNANNSSSLGNGGSNGGGGGGGSSAASTGSNSIGSAGSVTATTQLNETASSINDQHIAEGLPSPPITVAGSEIHSPGVPASSSSPHQLGGSNHNNNNNNSPSTANNNNNSGNNPMHNNNNNNNNNRSSPVKAAYCYDWMKKPSYPAQPTPGSYTEAAADHCTTSSLEDFTEYLDPSGKTRTKDKYRVVYTDYQRLELEKEYCTSHYITIRRKTELAQSLSLSERQVKIWFQNRRAKERKQNKKASDPTSVMGVVQHNDYLQHMDTKPKLEPGLHLQHSLHSMNAMAMNMPMSLHHLHHGHHPLSVSAAAAAHHSHQLHHQTTHGQMSAAAAASVNSLAM